MTRSHTERSSGGIVDLALGAGELTFRRARMTSVSRYKIDVRDEAHPVVCLNRDLTRDELVAAMPDIVDHLADLERARRRRGLLPVAELVGDESLLPEATGTDGLALRAPLAAVPAPR